MGWQFITGLMNGDKHSHSHLQAVKIHRLTKFACFGIVGGNQRPGWENLQTLNSIKAKTFSVRGDSANHCMLCCMSVIISVIQMNTFCEHFSFFAGLLIWLNDLKAKGRQYLEDDSL